MGYYYQVDYKQKNKQKNKKKKKLYPPSQLMPPLPPNHTAVILQTLSF